MISILFVILTTGLASCSTESASPTESIVPSESISASAPAESEAAGPVGVTVAYQPILSAGPMFVAEDLGYYSERGITNVYTSIRSGVDVLGLMSQGDLDVNAALGAGAAWSNALNSGLNVRAIASRLRYTCSSDAALVVSQQLWDQGLQSTADLEGRTVSVTARGTGRDYWLQLMLEQEGLTEDDLEEVAILSDQDSLTALQTGAIDYAVMVQPFVAHAVLNNIAQVVIPMHELVPDMEIGLYGSSTAFLEREGGDVAANWLAATLLGVRYLQDPANKEEVLDIIAKWTQVERGVLDALYGTDQWAWTSPNGEVDVENINEHNAWFLDNGLVESIPEDQGYDDTALRAALEEVGEVDVSRDCDEVPPFGE
ncbi:MAG: ABC transporter substrate-binding protein [Chloroflexota bacterium]